MTNPKVKKKGTERNANSLGKTGAGVGGTIGTNNLNTAANFHQMPVTSWITVLRNILKFLLRSLKSGCYDLKAVSLQNSYVETYSLR
jgi:hypothetical protein